RNGVDAIALMSWRRPIGKHVSLMTAAARAANLRALHAEGVINDQRQVFFGEGRREARPTGAAFEFLIRGEQRESTQLAAIDAQLLVVKQDTAERLLGAVVQQYVALLSRQRGFERSTLFRRGRRKIEIVLIAAGHVGERHFERLLRFEPASFMNEKPPATPRGRLSRLRVKTLCAGREIVVVEVVDPL